jgi:hypothetical protein
MGKPDQPRQLLADGVEAYNQTYKKLIVRLLVAQVPKPSRE